MSHRLSVSWEKPPALSPPIGLRVSKPAYAKLETYCLTHKMEKSTLLRELIIRGWKAEFGEDLDSPF